ncbi:hypothetical protein FI667_g622, partial [Globisporangium splendens]
MPRWPPLPPYPAHPIQRSVDKNYAPPPKRMPLQRIQDNTFNRPWNQAYTVKNSAPRPFPVFMQRGHYQNHNIVAVPQYPRKSDSTTTRRPKAERGLPKDNHQVNKASASENESTCVQTETGDQAIWPVKEQATRKDDATARHSIWSTTPQDLKTMMQKAKRANKSAKRMELQKMNPQRGFSWLGTERNNPVLECKVSDDSTGDESSDQEGGDTEEPPLRKYYSLIHMDSPIPFFSGVVFEAQLIKKVPRDVENSLNASTMHPDKASVLDYRKLFAMSANTPCFFPKVSTRGISKDDGEDPPLVNFFTTLFFSIVPDFNLIDATTLSLTSRSKTRRRKLLPTWTGGR